MSTTKSKTDLVRLSWLTELRRQGDRKCRGSFSIGPYVCALGLLAEIAAANTENKDGADVGSLAGLSGEQATEIAERNDGDDPYHRHTFAEIADVVERWFK